MVFKGEENASKKKKRPERRDETKAKSLNGDARVDKEMRLWGFSNHQCLSPAKN
jgi:hypothetical protein